MLNLSGKQNIWAQPKLIGTLLQSSEINTIKEKVRSLGKSDQAGGNKKTDLFSLHVLFSHFTSCDATLKNSFFQMSSLSTCKCTHNLWKKKRKIPMRISRALKWENITYKPRSSIGFWQIMWPRPLTLDLILPVVYAWIQTFSAISFVPQSAGNCILISLRITLIHCSFQLQVAWHDFQHASCKFWQTPV